MVEIIAKERRPIKGSEFVERYLLTVAENVSPDRQINFPGVNISSGTCTSRIKELEDAST